MNGKVCSVAIVIALIACATTPAFAVGQKGRWFGGGSISFRSTTDEIRSNASITLGPLGDDGLPNTFDPNESNDCASPGAHCDVRPDYLLNSPNTLEDSFQYDLRAGYMPFNWLSVQLDYSWFEASVGPVDAYLSDHFPVAANPFDPTTYFSFKDRDVRLPLDAGKLKENTLALSINYHFRTRGDIKPYVGVGAGRIFTNLEQADDISEFNTRVSHMRIREMTDQFFNDVTPKWYKDPLNNAHIPLPQAVKVDLADTSEWHLNAGVEYQLTEQISMTFDARYLLAPGGLRFDISGHDQLDLTTWSEKIYRPDGSVKIFRPGPYAPNPLCFDFEFKAPTCDDVHNVPPDDRVDPEEINPATGAPYFNCPAVGDFDGNGRLDVCYGHNVNPSPKGFTEARGDVVIQGGDIDLSAFTVSIGMKFRF